MNDAIAKCILSCGSQTFFDNFFSFINKELSVDQCNIFWVGNDDRISRLAPRNFLEGNITDQLAEAYLKGRYKEDPNIALITSMPTNTTYTIHLREYMEKLPYSYREDFFHAPGFADKVAILVKGESFSHYISLYRCSGKHRFLEDGLFSLHEGENIISALITKHYSLDSSSVRDNPLARLSERERQVCLGILSGKKAEAIAYELNLTPNSVITYRRRSYKKLGISSRSALFALCNA